jgi:anti-sigma factor RsiW
MNEFSTQSELLMRYLDEELQGQEKDAFERTLAENEALRTELENLRSLRTVIQRYGLEQQVAGIRA